MNLLPTLFDLLFNLLKQDFVELVNLSLQFLLQVTDSDNNRTEIECICKEEFIDLV